MRTTPSPDELIEFNKKNMSIVLPDVGESSANPDPGPALRLGCQFVCMNQQNMGDLLDHYLTSFVSFGSAFVLKPKNLRYIPVVNKDPAPPIEAQSYQTRHITLPYGDPLPI